MPLPERALQRSQAWSTEHLAPEPPQTVLALDAVSILRGSVTSRVTEAKALPTAGRDLELGLNDGLAPSLPETRGVTTAE